MVQGNRQQLLDDHLGSWLLTEGRSQRLPRLLSDHLPDLHLRVDVGAAETAAEVALLVDGAVAREELQAAGGLRVILLDREEEEEQPGHRDALLRGPRLGLRDTRGLPAFDRAGIVAPRYRERGCGDSRQLG